MQNRWFHVPVIHSPGPGQERRVGWLELFYDLIYVATLIQLGNSLSENVSVEGFLAFAGLLAPLWLTWTAFTQYSNRFVVDDLVHRVLVFGQMFAIGGIAVTVPSVFDGQLRLFSIFYGLARVGLVLLYVRTFFQQRRGREMTGRYARGFAVGAGLWLVSVGIPSPWVYLAWALAALIDLGLPVSRAMRELAGRYPVDALHLSERFGLLTLIVLGESFVKALTSIAAVGPSVEIAAMGAIGLVIVCSLWWIYFDDVAGSHVVTRPLAPWVWIYSHLPMTIAVTAAGVAIKKAVLFDPTGQVGAAYRWLLCGTLGLAFIAVSAIDLVTQRRQSDVRDNVRVNIRAISALVVLLLAPVGGFMPAWAFLAIVAAACAGQVIFDLSMAPLAADREQLVHGAQDAFGVAERVVEAPRAHRYRDVSEAVRRGAPSELRRDLYFYFMEGSWARVILFFAVAFVVANGIFAALYMLEPGSVTGVGSDSFVEAFFFSVQTMSTIGYGVMAPASTYAHSLVVVEAALGLLGMALATGLMFAKASRPHSGALFSDSAVVTAYEGTPTLIIRVGNARGNEVIEANMRLSALIDEVSSEGHTLRRIHDLELVRSSSPMFVLSWTVFHRLDERSPLHGIDADNVGDRLVFLVATMTGHDATYAQTVHARHVYHPEDVRFGEHFADIISRLDDGRMVVDYDQFHATIKDEEPAQPVSADGEPDSK